MNQNNAFQNLLVHKITQDKLYSAHLERKNEPKNVRVDSELVSQICRAHLNSQCEEFGSENGSTSIPAPILAVKPITLGKIDKTASTGSQVTGKPPRSPIIRQSTESSQISQLTNDTITAAVIGIQKLKLKMTHKICVMILNC